MDYIDQTVLDKRLQLAGCCISEKVDKVNKKLCFGIECAEEMLQIQILSALIEIPMCYKPVTTEDEDGVINTVTEAELDLVWDKFRDLCGICFPAKGTNIEEPPQIPLIVLLDELGDDLLDENDEPLFQEIFPLAKTI